MASTTGSAWSPSSPRTTAGPNSEVERIGKAIDEMTKVAWRHTSIFGNPVLRLLRCGVEVLVKKTHGAAFLKDQQAKTDRRATT